MSSYVIFDVQIHDPVRFQHFMQGARPRLTISTARWFAWAEATTSPRHPTMRWQAWFKPGEPPIESTEPPEPTAKSLVDMNN